MDTSIEYIKMCQQSKEIQQHCIDRFPDSTAAKEVRYHLTTGDSYYNPLLKSCFIYKENDPSTIGSYNLVWLPRQDQLQDLLLPHYGNSFEKLQKVINYEMYKVMEMKFLLHFPKTFEQWWLCFFMLHVHSKFWDSNKWYNKQEAEYTEVDLKLNFKIEGNIDIEDARLFIFDFVKKNLYGIKVDKPNFIKDIEFKVEK